MGERLTTPQAEKRTGATRWALMRAHKAGTLRGERDNRGRWQWDADELDRWTAQRPEPDTAQQPPQEPQDRAEVERLRADVLEARERAARAEGERDGLREALTDARSRAEAAEQRAAVAESETARLREATERRRGWWPFR